MDTKLTLTETLVKIGEYLGHRAFHKYLDGDNDCRIFTDDEAAAIALISDVQADQVEKDLTAIATEKKNRLLAKQAAMAAGREMLVEHGDAMTTAVKVAIGRFVDADRKG